MPPLILSLKNLTTLNISNNFLLSLDRNMNSLNNLKFLEANSNRLKEISLSLESLHNLIGLNVIIKSIIIKVEKQLFRLFLMFI